MILLINQLIGEGKKQRIDVVRRYIQINWIRIYLRQNKITLLYCYAV